MNTQNVNGFYEDIIRAPNAILKLFLWPGAMIAVITKTTTTIIIKIIIIILICIGCNDDLACSSKDKTKTDKKRNDQKISVLSTQYSARCGVSFLMRGGGR